MKLNRDKFPYSEIFLTKIAPLGGLLFLLVIFLFAIKNNSHANKDLSTQIAVIQKQLMQLSETGNMSDFKTALSGISNELMTIKNQENTTAKSSELSKIATQINIIKQNIDELKKIVSENANGKEFVDAKILPFHVVSVDVISQQPYVSIDYDHHITPLGVGDTIAGWQITEADYASSSVEFKNSKGQYVKVNLQG